MSCPVVLTTLDHATLLLAAVLVLFSAGWIIWHLWHVEPSSPFSLDAPPSRSYQAFCTVGVLLLVAFLAMAGAAMWYDAPLCSGHGG